MSDAWEWRFPPIAEPPGIEYQVIRVALEASEAEGALLSGEGAERLAEELMDVVHAAETALRMLDVDMRAKRDEVVAKNRERGHYGKERR